MDKSPEELLEYTIGRRKRGVSYRSILSYLNLHCDDPEIREKILEGLDKLENEGHIKPEPPAKTSHTYNTILGMVLMIFGATLAVFLWNHGWIATLPFAMIGAGFLSFQGKLKI